MKRCQQYIDILHILKPFNESTRGHGVACLCAQVTSLPLWLDHFHLILPVPWCFGRLSAEAHSYYSSTVPFHKHPQVGGMFNESSPIHTPLWSITCQFCGLRNSSHFVNATTRMIQNTSYIDGRVCEPSCDKLAFFLVATNIRVEQGLPCFPNVFALLIKTLHGFHLLRNWNTTNQSSSQKKKAGHFSGWVLHRPKKCRGLFRNRSHWMYRGFCELWVVGLSNWEALGSSHQLLTCCVPLCFWAAAFGSREPRLNFCAVIRVCLMGNGIWNLRKGDAWNAFQATKMWPPKRLLAVVWLLRWQICHCWDLVQQ